MKSFGAESLGAEGYAIRGPVIAPDAAGCALVASSPTQLTFTARPPLLTPIVPGALPTDYYAADGTFKPLPGASSGVTGLELRTQSGNSGGLWGPRDGSAMMFLGNDAYLIGGWYGDIADTDWDGGITTNQVFKSINFGVTWTRIRNHDLTPDATHFTPRHTFPHCTHTVGSITYMYMFAGDIDNPNSDIIRSIDGVTWNKVNTVPPGYAGTVLSGAVSYNGKLYVMGGCTSLNTADHKNAVWESSDHGETWTNIGNAPWSPRILPGQVCVHNGKIFVVGGGVYDDTLGRQYYNDVWSFNGTTWTLELAGGHSQWVGRFYANTWSLDGWIYLSRGFNTTNLADTYRSRDAKDWFSVIVDLPPSHADAVGVHSTGVLIGPGNYHLLNNVNSNSPTLYLKTRGTDLASGVSAMIQSMVPVSSNEFADIYLDNFIHSTSSGQYLLGEDSSGFYVAGGNISSVKPVYIGSGTTATTTIYGERVDTVGAIRLPNVSATGRSDQDIFAFSNQPASRGTWTGKAFRAYSFQYGNYCEYSWDENYADSHLWNAYPGDATYGGWKFLSGPSKLLRFYVKGNGALVLQDSVWHTSTDAKNRIYFGADGTTYIRGHATEPVLLQDGSGNNILTLRPASSSFNGDLRVGTSPGSTYRIESDGYVRAGVANANAVGFLSSNSLGMWAAQVSTSGGYEIAKYSPSYLLGASWDSSGNFINHNGYIRAYGANPIQSVSTAYLYTSQFKLNEGFASTEFYNSYPGDATYSGWTWSNGSTPVTRMTLTGNGFLTTSGEMKASAFRFANNSYLISDGTFNYSMDAADSPKAFRAASFYGDHFASPSGDKIQTGASGQPFQFLTVVSGALGVKVGSLVASSTYADVAPTDGIISHGHIYANQQIRLGKGLSWCRVAQIDTGGGWGGGYNMALDTGVPTYAENGSMAGIWNSTTGFHIYAAASGTSGTNPSSAVSVTSTNFDINGGRNLRLQDSFTYTINRDSSTGLVRFTSSQGEDFSGVYADRLFVGKMKSDLNMQDNSIRFGSQDSARYLFNRNTATGMMILDGNQTGFVGFDLTINGSVGYAQIRPNYAKFTTSLYVDETGGGGSIATPAKSEVVLRTSDGAYLAGRVAGRTRSANLGYSTLSFGVYSNITSDATVTEPMHLHATNGGQVTMGFADPQSFYRLSIDGGVINAGVFNNLGDIYGLGTIDMRGLDYVSRARMYGATGVLEVNNTAADHMTQIQPASVKGISGSSNFMLFQYSDGVTYFDTNTGDVQFRPAYTNALRLKPGRALIGTPVSDDGSALVVGGDANILGTLKANAFEPSSMRIPGVSALTGTYTLLTVGDNAIGFSGNNDADTKWFIQHKGCAFGVNGGGIEQYTGVRYGMVKEGSWNLLSGGTAVGGAFVVETSSGGTTGSLPTLSEKFRIGSDGKTTINVKGNLTRSIGLVLQNTSDTPIGADPNDYMDEVHLVLKAGTTENHRRYINFKNYDNSDAYIMGVNAGGSFIYYDSLLGHRMLMHPDGFTQLNSFGAYAVEINNYPGPDVLGTGGLVVYSGGSSVGRYKRFTVGESNTDHVQVKGQVWWGGTDSTGNGRLNSSGSDAYIDSMNGDLYLRVNGSTQVARLSSTEALFSKYVTSPFQLLASDPTTIDISSGNARLVKNTTTGSINLWANNVGVMQTVGSGGASATTQNVVLDVPSLSAGGYAEMVVSNASIAGTEVINCQFNPVADPENSLEDITQVGLRIFAKAEVGQVRFYITTVLGFVGKVAVQYKETT